MIPALYLSHGAPPLVDDELWVSQLVAWAGELPTPTAILVVSAHWESAPLTIGSTSVKTPLTYDFWGFPDRYYDDHVRRSWRRRVGGPGRVADAATTSPSPTTPTADSTTVRTSR